MTESIGNPENPTASLVYGTVIGQLSPPTSIPTTNNTNGEEIEFLYKVYEELERSQKTIERLQSELKAAQDNVDDSEVLFVYDELEKAELNLAQMQKDMAKNAQHNEHIIERLQSELKAAQDNVDDSEVLFVYNELEKAEVNLAEMKMRIQTDEELVKAKQIIDKEAQDNVEDSEIQFVYDEKDRAAMNTK
jgi:hypothetical protein